MLFFLGHAFYIIPIIFINFFFTIFFTYQFSNFNYLNLALHIIGIHGLIFSTSGFLEIYHSEHYFISGGVIGFFIESFFSFNRNISILLLEITFIVSIFLCLDKTWLVFFEKLGIFFIKFLFFFKNFYTKYKINTTAFSYFL